jgi:hypothetical protein
MRLIETQSTETIAKWCTGYARKHLLPLWKRSCPEDHRPASALKAAQDYLAGKIKLPDVKKHINDCRNAARETEGEPIAQGAARTIDTAASSVHNPAGSLGLALYGALTIAYNKAGTVASWETLEPLAAKECAKMEAALRSVAVKNEPNPVMLKWGC